MRFAIYLFILALLLQQRFSVGSVLQQGIVYYMHASAYLSLFRFFLVILFVLGR